MEITTPRWKCTDCNYTQDFESSTCHCGRELIQVEGKNIDWNSPEKKSETKESLLNSDPIKIYTGFKEIRLETEEEMLERGGANPVQREFPIYRTETKEERDIRIASEITKLNL